MMKRLMTGLCLGLFVSAAAFAAKHAANHAAIDLTGLAKPGEWAMTSVASVDGKAEKPDTDKSCLTTGDLRDFVSHDGGNDPKGTYNLAGHHLSFKGDYRVGGRKEGTMSQDMFFDDPTHWHGIMKILITDKSSPIKVIRVQMKARRIGPCTPDSDN